MGQTVGQGATAVGRGPVPPRAECQAKYWEGNPRGWRFQTPPERYTRDTSQYRRDVPREINQDRRRDGPWEARRDGPWEPRRDGPWQGRPNTTWYGGKGKGSRDDRDPGRQSPGRYSPSGTQGRMPVICYNCNKEGHMVRECPEPRRPRPEGGKGMSGTGRPQSPGAEPPRN